MTSNWYSFFAVVTVLFLTCTNFSDDNPADTQYQGDYSLDVDVSALPDSGEIFTPYRAAYEEGADRFEYLVSDALDSTLLNQSYDDDDDSLTLYFVTPVSGALTVYGVRPNLKKDSTTISVDIVNPCAVSGPSLAGLGDEVSYTATRSG